MPRPDEDDAGDSRALTGAVAVQRYTKADGGHTDDSRVITAVACCPRGRYLAYGDRAGRLHLRDRDEPQPGGDGAFGDYASVAGYAPFVDPLCSVDVSPAINRIAFVPQTGPTLLVLTANDKVPKLWKVTTAQAMAAPFRAVDRLDAKAVGPLTLPSQRATACREVSKYNMDHEYNINGLCVLPSGDQFVTTDDLTVRLWHAEHAHQSMTVCDLKPADGGDVRETVASASIFPREPSLLFCTTSGGMVRVLDMRQSLRLTVDPDSSGSGGAAMVFANPPRAVDGNYNAVCSLLTGCALSPCGRYLAGRDFMSVPLWDVRKVGAASAAPRCGFAPGTPMGAGALSSFVRRWVLHPQLSGCYDALYESETLFSKFNVAFSSAHHWVTGGFHGAVCMGDVADAEADVSTEALIQEAAFTQVDEGAPLPPSPYEKPTGSARLVLLGAGRGPEAAAPGDRLRSVAPAACGYGGMDGHGAADGSRVAHVAVDSASGDVFAAVDDVLHHARTTCR
jgi:serine/threonine-protein phosphatase 2A regulatory subunit B